ncbi:MAG: glycosyltransferase family 2 protein [Candidatus Kerfeldbacteria bacterium]|nr:glycosyltransferase family 2 protein [Candidatus Kerfeldbacteria bacterium]
MKPPHLSVILPAYCEAERIGATLDIIQAHLSETGYQSELIVVDDGSPDATTEVVRAFQAKSNLMIKLIIHERNKGKGAAVRTGMRAATGTYALFADADNATPFDEVAKLLSAADKGADVVIASRYLPGSNVVKKQSLLRRAISRGGNLLFRLLLRLPFSDTRCGFKLFNRRSRDIIFARQTIERWGFDTEILVIALRHHLNVAEVPVRWYDRERGNIRPVRDAIRALGEILHILRLSMTGAYE